MSVIGEAFIAIRPEASKFEAETKGIVGKILGAIPGGALTVGISGALVGITGALAGVGEEFQKVFFQIRRETGATGTALDGLKQSFKNVVSAVPASFGDAANALILLRQRTNETGPALEALTKAELNLARITKTDLNSNVDATTKIFAAFGVKAKDQVGALDSLFRVSQASGVSVGTLAESTQKFGAILRSFGFDLGHAEALVASFTKAGINTGPAFAALRKAVATFAKEGKDAPSALRELFLQIKNAPTTVEAAGIALKVFGARAGPELTGAIRDGRLSLDGLFKTVEKSHDTIEQASKDTRTLGETFTLLKNKALVALEPLATGVLKAIETIVEGFSDPEKKLNAKGFTGTLLGLGATLHSVFDTLKKDVGDFIAGFVGKGDVFETPFAQLGVTARNLADTFKNTVLPALTSVASFLKDTLLPPLVGLAELLFSNKTLVVGVVAALVTFKSAEIAITVVTALRGAVVALNVALSESAAATLGFGAAEGAVAGVTVGATGLIAGVAAAGVALGVVLNRLIESHFPALNRTFERFGAHIVDAGAGFASFTGKLVTGAAHAVEGVANFFKGLPGRITGAIGDLGNILFTAGQAVIDGLIRGIKSSFKKLGSVLGAVTDFIIAVKGPRERDLLMLKPAGEAIMKGLIGGIEDQRALLRQALERVAGDIHLRGSNSTSSTSTGGGFGGSTTTNITVNEAVDPMATAEAVAARLVQIR